MTLEPERNHRFNRFGTAQARQLHKYPGSIASDRMLRRESRTIKEMD